MALKVISYNIHKGLKTGNAQFILHDLKSMLKENDADILFLQEVVGKSDIMQDRFKDAWPSEGQFEYLADTVWPHFSYGKNAVKEGHHHGNAILSKYPIKTFENIDITTNRFEQRGLLHCVIEHQGRKLDLLNVHLNLTEKGRSNQTPEIIKRGIHHCHGDAFILAGDFNDWRGKVSEVIEREMDVKEAFYEHEGHYAKSYPSFYPFFRLDRIFYQGLDVKQCQVLQKGTWRKLSDHLPLEVKFDYSSMK